MGDIENDFSEPREQLNETGKTRREALKLGLFGIVASLPGAQALAKSQEQESDSPQTGHSAHDGHKKAGPNKKNYIFFNTTEQLFIEAAVARLIPADETWGGAVEADVPNYIDKQLGGAWGAGERLYRSGPWHEGAPSQGYQLPFTPAELYRNALRAIDSELEKKKTPFHKMSAADQDAYLKDLEKSDRDLDGVPAKVFFGTFLKSTMEGFFADPVYGGNKDMISWKMIGFPGAAASYFELVDKHGIKITRAPMSLAEDSMGHMHMNPNIPAHIPKNN